MKTMLITIIILFCLIVNVKAQTTTSVPFYGITPTGKIYFIEKNADALGSPGQTIEVSGDWNGKNTWTEWTAMALQDYNGTGVYVLDIGKKMKGTKILCFRISPDCYFPAAAKEKTEYLINVNDMVLNNKGDGYNLKIEVGSFDF